jgi:hypothetical protein
LNFIRPNPWGGSSQVWKRMGARRGDIHPQTCHPDTRSRRKKQDFGIIPSMYILFRHPAARVCCVCQPEHLMTDHTIWHQGLRCCKIHHPIEWNHFTSSSSSLGDAVQRDPKQRFRCYSGVIPLSGKCFPTATPSNRHDAVRVNFEKYNL